MHGLVVKNTGSWYTIHTPDGRSVECKVKGTFRLKGIRSTNPVVIGDRVEIEENQEGTAYITDIHERRNYMIRRSTNLSKQSHILAANLDLAILVITVNYPQTTTVFIDRFLATAEAYRIPVLLLFNKKDRYDTEELAYMEALIRLYTQIGYPCLKMCATTGEGLSDLKQALLGKISLFSGHSGVGKSTIINLLSPDINLKTNKISEYHKKGMHTTTFSEMIPLPIAESESHPLIGGEYVSETPEKSGSDNAVPDDGNISGQPEKAGTSLPLAGGGYVIDTPGIKGFGTIEMEGAEISHYFKEIFHYAASCRFNNCTHRNEPGCAVVKAVKDQYISESRYKSYLNILEDKDDIKYREAY